MQPHQFHCIDAVIQLHQCYGLTEFDAMIQLHQCSEVTVSCSGITVLMQLDTCIDSDTTAFVHQHHYIAVVLQYHMKHKFKILHQSYYKDAVILLHLTTL